MKTRSLTSLFPRYLSIKAVEKTDGKAGKVTKAAEKAGAKKK
jgi:hypothetical protein